MTFASTYSEALAKRQARDAKRHQRKHFRHNRLRTKAGASDYAEAGNSSPAQSRLKRARLKPGRKVKEWGSERARLKKRFLAVGIITCELKYPGCRFDDYLGFAHAKKRRKLDKEDLSVVILACHVCHDAIETDPRMEEIVMAVIGARKVQP